MVSGRTQKTQLYDSKASAKVQRERLRGGEIPVAVYGLGKMGLPLATVFATVTKHAVGADIDESVVREIRTGGCPVRGEPGLADSLETAVDNGWLRVTSEPTAAARDAQLHVLIVPTVVDEENDPDLSALRAVIDDVGAGLAPGDTVFVESTVPPGTCRDIVQPELAAASGLATDQFGLAFCPERTASGRALRDIQSAYPKVVGGIDDESTRVAELVYGEITENDVIPVTDCTTAECVKVFEGLYRDVNIGLANELAQLADELAVDVREAIDVANMPGYCDIHEPGPGVGGHCIPVYPYFIINGCETSAPLLRTARQVNEGMPDYTVGLLERALETRGVPLSDASVALLGVTYRPGVDEIRKAPAFDIAELLTARGSSVHAVDPVCSDLSTIAARPATLEELSTLDLDAVVLVTPQSAFESLDWELLGDVVVIDSRGSLDPDRLTQPVYVLGDGRTRDDSSPREVEVDD